MAIDRTIMMDDFGTKRTSLKGYREVALKTAGTDDGEKCIAVDSFWDYERDMEWLIGVWRDSPESGPRMCWPA